MAGPFIAASLSFLLMLAAMYWHRLRRFHVTAMASVMLFDVGMPFYLVATRDWKIRLIDHGDIMSFGVWMHFGLIVTLYVLYVIQLQTALKILRSNGKMFQRMVALTSDMTPGIRSVMPQTNDRIFLANRALRQEGCIIRLPWVRN